jgi:uncharacterized protein YgiM (DUF1202 family)
MRAQILRILIALMLVAGLGLPTLQSVRAQDDGDIAIGDTVRVEGDVVNLRDTAGTDGDIITTLAAGTTLEILDGPESADGYIWWMGVVLDEDSVDQGISGWIVEDFLIVDDVETPDDGDDDETPTPEPTDTPEPTETPDDGDDDSDDPFADAQWVEVVDGPLNLRQNPGLEGDVIRTLAEGETATVVEQSALSDLDDYTWINITTEDDDTGWVATDFLDVLDEDPCPDDECEPTEPSEDQELLDADAVVVIDGPLNLRSDPSLDGTIVDTIATGTIVNTWSEPDVQSADGYDWLRIDYLGLDAWLAVDFVSVSDDVCEDSPCLPVEDPGDDPFADALGIRVFDGPLNVRDIAGLSGSIVTVLETGAEVPVDSRAVLTDADGYTWIRIATPQLNGWVATAFVEPLDEVPCSDGACYPTELNQFFGATGAYVIDGPLNLRANPDTGADILMVLLEGDYLFIESVIGPDPYEADGYLWIQVTPADSGLTGYVAIDFIEAAD